MDGEEGVRAYALVAHYARWLGAADARWGRVLAEVGLDHFLCARAPRRTQR